MAIIAISGKVSSGKDTVGKIIQYLTDIDTDSITYEQWSERVTLVESNWKIKKFADKLKDIVCLLLGCTRKQLEDQKFKEKELGEEWNYNSIIQFADYIKIPRQIGNAKMTVRQLLQEIGTEAMRNQIHPNIWVNALMGEYISEDRGKISGKNYLESNWLITDMRFPNELEAVKLRKGITIRVNRPHGYIDKAGVYKEIPLNYHESETALDNAEFNYVITNNSTINDLIEKVKDILCLENIL